jgi:4-oxalocrotonate tautomerase
MTAVDVGQRRDYPAPRATEEAMPEIIIYLAEGRTVEAKRAVAKDITDTIVKNFNVPADAVTIQIVEAAKENKAKGGKLFIDR